MISIVLPAKNEAAALRELLPRLRAQRPDDEILDRKSTRLNSSHLKLSRMPSSA